MKGDVVKVDYGQLLQNAVDGLTKAQTDFENAKPGTEEYLAASKAAETFNKMILEDEKAEIEQDLAYSKLELEQARMNQEARDKKIDRWVNISIKGVEIAVPTFVYIYLYNKGLKFEQTGVIASGSMRNLLQKIPNPFRK